MKYHYGSFARDEASLRRAHSRAQHAYDSMSPPEEPECPECGGELDAGGCIWAQAWARHDDEPEEYPEPECDRCSWTMPEADDYPEDDDRRWGI